MPSMCTECEVYQLFSGLFYAYFKYVIFDYISIKIATGKITKFRTNYGIGISRVMSLCDHLPYTPWNWLQLIEAGWRIYASVNSSLVQIMACRLIATKPLSKPILDYCQLDPCEHISVKTLLKYHNFHWRKCTSAKWRPSCLGLYVLNIFLDLVVFPLRWYE